MDRQNIYVLNDAQADYPQAESIRLYNIKYLKTSNESDWGAPYLAQPQSKSVRVSFLGKF